MSTKKPSPYIPSFLKAAIEGHRPLQLTFSEVKDTNILSTSSFIYDASDAPIKSTQQLHVDWSKFENHTFFMSAEAKVNLAFDQIINGYPFDGTKQEVESFFEKLSGFDRYIFDSFPKFHGQLMFSGSVNETSPTAGSYIVVKDAAGALYPELSKTSHGQSVLNPKGTSLSIEMQLYLPQSATMGTQVICQKMNGTTQGYSLYLMPTLSSSSVEARFSVVSGSQLLTVPCELQKGKFNHICATLNKETTSHYLQFYRSAELIANSKSNYAFGELNIDASDFIIGSGTTIALGSTIITPTQTLSGTIDEFRVFHATRSANVLKQYASKAIYAQPDLKLYYRFNEPPPPLATSATDQANAIVIDHSGNSLHSTITNFLQFADYDANGNITGSKLRQNASLDPASNVIYEKEETVPVLFPAYQDIIDLNVDLLSSASEYDRSNPNLISKLIPQHYFLEGTVYDGFEEPEGSGGVAYSGNGIPGEGKLGNVQLLLSMLYIFARFFDEMKLFIDSFSSVRTVDYDINISTPNNFLRDIIKQYGFYLPPMFNDSTLEQYISGENIGQEISASETPLKYVQNELLRRVIINLPDVLKSKGTQHGIKVFLRAIGIDPENSVRLREYGGPTTRQLSFSRENKRDVATMVEFSSSSLAISPYLSSSRTEPGYPTPAGTFVSAAQYPPYGISDNQNDGLLTSGSWTVETIVKYTPYHTSLMTNSSQSLCRMFVTGSESFMSGSTGLIANLVAMSSSYDPKLVLYLRPGTSAQSPTFTLTLNLPNDAIFGGDKWNVSFGRERNDSIESRVSSSYFLRAATQNNGEIQYIGTTSSYFYEVNSTEDSCLTKLSASFNQYGAFLAVGENQQIPSGSVGYYFLNNISNSDSGARLTAFSGLQSNFRFWSKALTVDEWSEHVRNYKSAGVIDPKVNYNFVTTRSGSFERLRLDSFNKQSVRRANATASLGALGEITFLDFSLNRMHMSGTGFPIERDCVRGEIFDVSYLSPYFDEAATNEKVRIRSFFDQGLIDSTPWAAAAPVHEIVKSERPTDDVRFSIEFSLIDALNRDIVTMFATLNSIDNALGSPELMSSPDYPDLETLRNVYFNRIKENLNFKNFFEFFRWFDTTIGTFIEQLVPKKTNFKGTNFVIESHMLERHKLQYQTSEQYLGDARNRIRDVLLLQQITGVLRKF